MIELFLIRHAECEVNTMPNIIGGRSTDSPLTSNGRLQARVLGQAFYKWRSESPSRESAILDKVVSSNAIRAKETAKVALYGSAKNRNDGPFPNFEELAELSQGDWEGRNRDDCYTEDVMKTILKNEGYFKPPNGESQKEVSDRMEKWINENVIQEYSDKNAKVAIVSHGIAIKCFLQRIMGFSQDFIYHMHLGNCSITQLQYHDRWVIKGIGSSGISTTTY